MLLPEMLRKSAIFKKKTPDKEPDTLGSKQYLGQQAVPATVVQTGRIAMLCSTRREHKSNCAALHPKQGTNLTGRNCC
jgi:hypothetical protein